MSLKSGISVIVTVFNKEKFIENTLKSIEPQMNKNVQLIIVDDGSTDDSKKKIKNFLKNKKYNFKFISKINTGPSISINTALKFVKFSHIKIVDGDDIIAPDSLKYMFSEMKRLKLDLLYGHWEWVKNIFNYKFKKDSSPSFIFDNAFKKFILSGWGGSSNLMVRTDAFKKVGGFDESVFVQDYSLPLKIAGFHLKNKTNKRLSVGLSKKLICVGPKFVENRVMSNKAQTLYDLSIATINFIESHPFIDRKIIERCKKKILSRCWSWQKKELGVSFLSKNYFLFLKNKYIKVLPLNHIKLIVLETWRKSEIRKIESKDLSRKKILVYVGLDLLGDALLKLPALRFLKECYPNSEIIWFAGKGKSIFSDKLKPLSKNLIFKVKDKINFGSSFWEFFKKIDLGNYDIVIDTQKRFLTTILLKRIRTKLFISTSCKQFFSDIPLAHKPEKNLSLSLVKLINLLSNKSFHFNYVHLSKNTRNVAICPGASTDIKRWRLDYFLEVGSFLIKKNFTPVFIIGPNEFEMIPLIKKSLRLSRIVKSIDPLKTIKISKTCQFGLSNDTGCGHLIAASGIPVIIIFGPTDPQKFSPISNPKNISISSQKNFSSKDIDLIEPSFVIEKIKNLLNIK